ncbi:aromatic-ring-hydroxylating dioxygenase subunit beta [Undibacterium sp.]|uniref:aromatic-ring-hydroxylating dioxygenase subunit beta n=1 Tax=Undibacterium sp. TaxID=1914977 RepID=UPI00374CC769
MATPITYEQLNVLNAMYAQCIDDDRLEHWPDFFLQDCLYKITNAENHRQGMEAGIVYADSKGMLQDRVSALREANVYERQSYRHIVSMPVMGEAAQGRVSVETSFMVVRIMRGGKSDLFATGKYVDQVVQDASGALKFAERIVICDSISIDTLLAIPL